MDQICSAGHHEGVSSEGVRLWGKGDVEQVLNKKGEGWGEGGVSPFRGEGAALEMVPRAASLASPFRTGHSFPGQPAGEAASRLRSVHTHTPQVPSRALVSREVW